MVGPGTISVPSPSDRRPGALPAFPCTPPPGAWVGSSPGAVGGGVVVVVGGVPGSAHTYGTGGGGGAGLPGFAARQLDSQAAL